MTGVLGAASPPGLGPSPSPRRPRSAWFLFVTKVDDKYELHVGYKNSKGGVSEYSCSKSNASVKIPFGCPVMCEYILTRDGDESFGEFQFTSSRREVMKLKLSHLNCFEGGSNAFSKKITSMVIDKNEALMAQFLTLLSHSQGYVLHREEIHTDDGEYLEDLIEVDGLLNEEDVLKDYHDFVKAACESAQVVTRKTNDIRQFFGVKRKEDADSREKKGPKKSKAATVDEREKAELQDETGIEKEYQQSFVGLANISLDNIIISPDLEESVSKLRVDMIVQSIEDKYDPSLSIPVVCPVEGETILDLQNVKGMMFAAVQKIHCVAAFKKLDQEGKFANLVSHKKRTVPCYVLKMASSGLIHYGNMRSNNITHPFSRQTSPQDLLRTYHYLSSKDGPVSSLKVLDRMAALARIGPNESSALRKLCSWKDSGLKALMEVLTKYERYDSMDKKPKGYQTSLFEGKKMTMPNVLFKQLGKVTEDFFLNVHQKILNDERSLKSCLDDYELVKKVENVAAVLSILADYRTYESIKLNHPGKFEAAKLKEYFGAEILKDGEKNKLAEKLEMYYESVVSGEFDDDESIKLVEVSDLGTTCTDSFLDTFELVIVHMGKQENLDSVLELLNRRLMLQRERKSTIVIFPTETSQFQALSFVRSLENKDISLQIRPLLFHGYSHVSEQFDENLKFGLLVGSFSVLPPPLKIFHNSILNLPNIVDRICSPRSEVALISGRDVPIVQIHRGEALARRVTYFGTSGEISQFKIQMKVGSARTGSGVLVKEVLNQVDENQSSTSPVKASSSRLLNRSLGGSSMESLTSVEEPSAGPSKNILEEKVLEEK